MQHLLLTVIGFEILSSTVTAEFGGKFKEELQRRVLDYIKMDTTFWFSNYKISELNLKFLIEKIK
jgi:hypothetical protein